MQSLQTIDCQETASNDSHQWETTETNGTLRVADEKLETIRCGLWMRSCPLSSSEALPVTPVLCWLCGGQSVPSRVPGEVRHTLTTHPNSANPEGGPGPHPLPQSTPRGDGAVAVEDRTLRPRGEA
ncbi:hypothetical protein ACOMHN_056038 [Nucella lapillus]